MNKLIFVLVALFLVSVQVEAQQLNAKPVIHPTVGVGERFYLTAWLITNIREDVPDNINLFPGVGYRTKLWWVEGLWWKHWNAKGSATAADLRFGVTHRRAVFAGEVSRFFKTGDVYTFAAIERPVTSRARIGLETENFFREKKSLAVGPRASYVLGKAWGGPLVVSAAYQVRPNEPDVLRGYLVFHPRW